MLVLVLVLVVIVVCDCVPPGGVERSVLNRVAKDSTVKVVQRTVELPEPVRLGVHMHTRNHSAVP